MKKEFLPPHQLGLLIAICCAVVFGFWPTAVRGIYADGGNITFALLLTTWVRALCMGGFCVATGRPLFKTREDVRQAIIGGFVQTISVVGMYMALKFLPGPIVIIIVFSHTIMLLFYMAWKKEIKLDVFTVLTTLVALGGLSLVLDVWHSKPEASWIGIVLSFIAAIATVGRLYVFGQQTKTRHPVVVGAEVFLVTAVLINVSLFYELPHVPNATGLWYAGFCCVALTIGTLGMFYGIALLGSFRWSLFLKLEPVFTSLFAALFLNEVLKPHQYAGIALVVGTLAIYQIVEHRRKIDVL